MQLYFEKIPVETQHINCDSDQIMQLRITWTELAAKWHFIDHLLHQNETDDLHIKTEKMKVKDKKKSKKRFLATRAGATEQHQNTDLHSCKFPLYVCDLQKWPKPIDTLVVSFQELILSVCVNLVCEYQNKELVLCLSSARVISVHHLLTLHLMWFVDTGNNIPHLCVRLAVLAMETDFILTDNKYKACLNGNIVSKSVHM